MPFTTYHILQDMLRKQLLHPIHPSSIESIKEKHFEFHLAFEGSEKEQIDRMRTHVFSYLRCKQIESESLKEIINELLKGAECGTLSVFQLHIFISKFTGASFKTLKKMYGISSDAVISRIVKRTACGKHWDKYMKGGRDSLLSDLDISEFVKIVEERESDINCISTCEARKIAIHLQELRIEKARKLLFMCGCYNLANELHTIEPDPTWLLKMARRHGLSIVPRAELEKMRRIACDKTAIQEFFSKHSHLLQRDPRLIFNMDETMVSSNKKFKVLATKNHVPLSTSPQTHPHITACITIGAAGYVMKPMFIIPNKKTLKGLEQFIGSAYFASSKSGWMNKTLFTYWSFLFIAEMSIYRLSLPPELRNQRILLLLDGHKSRVNYFVARLFESFMIDVLVFPGHTSHLLQAFDVAVASPLKSAYKKWLLLYNLNLDNLSSKGISKMKTREIRIMMIKCLLNALSESATLGNIQSGFQASGIFPLNPEVPLSSRYAMDDSLRNQFPELYEKIKNGNLINGHHLNGNLENLSYLYNLEFHSMPLNDNFKMSIEMMKQKVKDLHLKTDGQAVILTNVPDIIYEDGDAITRIKLNE